ncbi:hypothetical protein PpBr36_02138 [Pyricularia pennisetigena]|uniref:hypothetical protein n=1 Tax=Pyricularia pennisetigena TaxID=1578925 RepID=UPI001151ED60|nr:hypothetical protein PpBr36_02138 [Pyricularia pennisetigena]TLS29419.1 hypothetical protein PpBr36_02138 [Pyricularia pennisetigena]
MADIFSKAASPTQLSSPPSGLSTLVHDPQPEALRDIQGWLQQSRDGNAPKHVGRRLVVPQLSPHPLPDLGIVRQAPLAVTVGRPQERAHHLAQALRLEPHDDGGGHRRVLDQPLLDLERVDVLAAPDDDVLEPARDATVAVGVEHGLVARLEPQHPVLVPHHHLGRLLRVVPVARLQLVPRDAELAAPAQRDRLAVAVHDLGVRVRHQRPHRRQPPRHHVVGEGVEARRARLRQPVAARELGHAQSRHHLLHQVSRHRRPGHDARAELQVAGLELRRFRQREERVEHGRHPVQRRAALLLHGPQCRSRIKDLGRVHHLAAVRDGGQHAQDEPEAVEEWWRAAQDVCRSEPHAVADVAGVVDEVAGFSNHQDATDPGNGEKDGYVLLAVAGHDAYPVAHADAHGQQRPGDQAALLIQLVVGPARPRPGDHDALLGPVLLALQVQQLAQRKVDQWRVDRPVEDRKPLPLGRGSLYACHWLC